MGATVLAKTEAVPLNFSINNNECSTESVYSRLGLIKIIHGSMTFEFRSRLVLK